MGPLYNSSLIPNSNYLSEAGPYAPTAGASGSWTPNPTVTAVAGANTTNSNSLGSLYYDTTTGAIQEYDPNTGTWGDPSALPDYNPNPTNSFFTSDGTQVGSQQALDSYNAASNQYSQGRDNIFNTATGSADNTVLTGRGGILSYIDSMRQAQQGVDLGRTNVIRSQQRNTENAQQMVGDGIRSSGVALSNKNAVDSSATGEIARAYGVLGNRQIQSGNNEAITKNAELDLTQAGIGTGLEAKKRDLEIFKQTEISRTVQQAQTDLTALDAQAQGAGLAQRFQIEQEKNRIKDAVTAKLGELDGLLNTESAKIAPTDVNTLRSNATTMNQAGATGGDMFNFSQDTPMNFNGGASNSGLPIYTLPRKKV